MEYSESTMASIQPFCVFCSKKTEKLNIFTAETMEKCKFILEIRKENNLAMSNAKVPNNISDFQRYHSRCYRTFTALPPKYRKCVESTSISATAE